MKERKRPSKLIPVKNENFLNNKLIDSGLKVNPSEERYTVFAGKILQEILNDKPLCYIPQLLLMKNLSNEEIENLITLLRKKQNTAT